MSDLDDITSWLGNVIPELERRQQSDPAASIEDMAARAKELKVKFKERCSRTDDECPEFVCIFTDFFLAGDAEDVCSLQVHHAVCEPASSGSARATGETGRYEPTMEPSEHRPSAVGHQSEKDADALPGEKTNIHIRLRSLNEKSLADLVLLLTGVP